MILYVETNFIMGGARGQTEAYDGAITAVPQDSLTIILPSLCIAEAVYSMQRLREEQAEFAAILQSQIGELERDRSAERPAEALQRLNAAVLTYAEVFNGIETRFRSIMDGLAGIPSGHPRALVAPLLAESIAAKMLNDGTWSGLKPPLKMPDYLILCTILHHAAGHPGETKLFLSSNEHDFRREREVLKMAGIDYFTDAAKALARVRFELSQSA
jgi:hypothetical protein